MLQRRILTILLVGLSGLIFTASAGAAKSPHRYSPKHGADCHKTYTRVVKHRRHHERRVFCVRNATAKKQRTAEPKSVPTVAPAAVSASAPTTSEKPKLHAHLDPEYVQDPLNPFHVTYSYSASASQAVQGFAVQEAAPLPSGVLSFYSDGSLECAINVGPGIEGSECPVTYKALGEHRVTTLYTSGEESATETEVENIEPLASTLSLAVEGETSDSGATLLLSITVTSSPAIPFATEHNMRMPTIDLSLPGYWSFPQLITSGQPLGMTVGIACRAGKVWLFTADDSSFFKSPEEAPSFFEGRKFVARFQAPGYLPSVAEVAIPAFACGAQP